jgi:7TM diverse intracellular signalling/Histidine kinase/7TMR-DISM extracellular 2
VRLRLWTFFFYLALLAASVSAQPTMLLYAPDTLLPVSQGLAVFAEPAGPLTFSAVRPTRFGILPNGNIDFGHTDRGGWVRFAVSNRVSARQPGWVLRVMGVSSMACDLYVVEPDGRVSSQPNGIRFPYYHRPFDALTFNFPLSLPDARPRVCYLRLAGVNAQQYTLNFLSDRLAQKTARDFESLMCLYFGALLAMFAYNLLLFVQVRDAGYLWYVLYLAAILFMHLSMYGMAFKYLWPDNPAWAMKAQNMFTGLTISTAVAFAVHFLDIRRQLPRLLPVFYAFLGVGLVIAGMALIQNTAALTAFVSAFAIPVILTAWVVAVIVWQRGYRPALLYVLGWAVLFVTITLFLLQNLGLIPVMPLANFLMPIGTAVEMMLFSFGLGYRINLSRREKAQLRQQRTEAETRALRAQMNPHFVFNCMNTIDYYVLSEQPERASAFLQRFSQLVRNVLEQSREEQMLVADELSTLRLYLDLERERNNNQFDYQIIAETIPPDTAMPPLLIQPFAENAILHGLRHKTDARGQLTILLVIELGGLVIEIIDNGIGRAASAVLNQPPGNRAGQKKSLGLTVTSERIAALGPGAGVTIDDLQPGTRVRLRLPMRRDA